MMKRLVIVAVAAVLGFVGYTYYTTTQRIPVKTVPVTRGNVLVMVSTVFTGSIASEREATLSFQTAGQLVYVGVQEGGTVRAGDVVGRLDDVEAQAQVLLAESNLRAAQAQLQRAKLSVPLEDSQVRAEITQSQASLENAATTYRRWQDLFAKGAVARQQVEDAQMRYDMARSRHEAALAALARNAAKQQEIAAAEATVKQMEATLTVARIRFDQTVLRAPFTALVTHTYANVGEFVGIGKPIVHCVDPTSLHVKAVVDEADALRVRGGQRALVTMDAFPGRKLEGHVVEVSPVISTARQESRTSEVKIRLDDSPIALKPGLSADIEIVVQEVPDTLTLPTHVILERERGKYVYVVTNARVQERSIQVGASNWDLTAITAGLREGERVIVPLEGAKLEDGRAVQMLE
jgi:HlyD family secretion protein